MTATPTASSPPPGDHVPFWRSSRVPVEHRFLGLDRRTFPFALAAIVIWAIWALVAPRVAGSAGFEDEVTAGERFAVSSGLVFTPAPGWNVVKGFRANDSSAVSNFEPVQLTSGGVSFVVDADEFSGAPGKLLDQVNKVNTRLSDEPLRITTQRWNVKTDSGLVAVAEGAVTGTGDLVLVALVDGKTGIEIQILGPREQLAEKSNEIARMVESIDVRDGSQAATS